MLCDSIYDTNNLQTDLFGIVADGILDSTTLGCNGRADNIAVLVDSSSNYFAVLVDSGNDIASLLIYSILQALEIVLHAAFHVDDSCRVVGKLDRQFTRHLIDAVLHSLEARY